MYHVIEAFCRVKYGFYNNFNENNNYHEVENKKVRKRREEQLKSKREKISYKVSRKMNCIGMTKKDVEETVKCKLPPAFEKRQAVNKLPDKVTNILLY